MEKKYYEFTPYFRNVVFAHSCGHKIFVSEGIMTDKGILIITPIFSPDIGGVETHLDDLVRGLSDRKIKVYVCTHKPIVTSGVKKYKRLERIGDYIRIYRYWWIGLGLFHKLEKFPPIQFLYLCPYLFIRTFTFLLFNHTKIEVIHAQGLSGALIGLLLKKIFKKRLIVSTHAIYELEKNSGTAIKIAYILNQADKVLTLSRGSYSELVSFGVRKEKLGLHRYWIDLMRFRRLDNPKLRKKLKIDEKFNVLFVGRFIRKKGVRVLIDVAKKMPGINFLFIGVGPDEKYITDQSKLFSNIIKIGMIPNKELYNYYNIADVFCIPSQYEEGFGRVVMEAVACGLPVIGSNKGGLPEALDSSVAILGNPTGEIIQENIRKLFNDRNLLKSMKQKCSAYAMKNFSEKNIELIVKHY